MLLVPQSFGSLLNHHPHAHGLTSLGVSRSPPAIDTSTTLFDEEFSQLPPQEEEDLSQDPPGPDEPL